jgi:hypothetical protein
MEVVKLGNKAQPVLGVLRLPHMAEMRSESEMGVKPATCRMRVLLPLVVQMLGTDRGRQTESETGMHM